MEECACVHVQPHTHLHQILQKKGCPLSSADRHQTRSSFPVGIRGPAPPPLHAPAGSTALGAAFGRDRQRAIFLSRPRRGMTCSEVGECKQHYFLSIELPRPLLARPERGLPAEGKGEDPGFITGLRRPGSACCWRRGKTSPQSVYCSLVTRANGAMTFLFKVL